MARPEQCRALTASHIPTRVEHRAFPVPASPIPWTVWVKQGTVISWLLRLWARAELAVGCLPLTWQYLFHPRTQKHSSTLLSILQWLNHRLWKFVWQFHTIEFIFQPYIPLPSTTYSLVWAQLVKPLESWYTKSRAANVSLFPLGALRLICQSQDKFQMNHHRAKGAEPRASHLLEHRERCERGNWGLESTRHSRALCTSRSHPGAHPEPKAHPLAAAHQRVQLNPQSSLRTTVGHSHKGLEHRFYFFIWWF